MRSLGCDKVIDYTVQDISSVEGRFDAGLDLVGGKALDQMFDIMKPGTMIVSVAGVPEPQTAIRDLGGRRALSAIFWLISYGVRARARRAGVGYRYVFMHPSGRDLSLLAELIDQGKLKVIVDRTYPFAGIAEALDYVESGRAKGKVVVTIVEDSGECHRRCAGTINSAWCCPMWMKRWPICIGRPSRGC